MDLLTVVSNIRMGDMIFQLIFFIILIALVTGFILLITKFNQRNKKLDRMERKIDQLLTNQDQSK